MGFLRKNVEALIHTRLQPGDRWSGEGETVLNGFLILAWLSSPGLKPGVNETEPITENSTAFGVPGDFCAKPVCIADL